MSMFSNFSSADDSHIHSLQILDMLFRYDDFMESVDRVADLGCGKEGLDMLWWATRTTRGDEQIPLEIKCTGFDIIDKLSCKHQSISYQKQDIEQLKSTKKPYDILWCHDTFQYLLNPLECLKNWRNIAAEDAMLVLSIPQTTNVIFNKSEFNIPSGHYYHYTMTNLLYMLAVNGWDCLNGFFLKEETDVWINAVVYKSNIEPMDPRTTSWYDLADTGLLPETAVRSILNHGHIRQSDLIVPWLDKSTIWMDKH